MNKLNYKQWYCSTKKIKKKTNTKKAHIKNADLR